MHTKRTPVIQRRVSSDREPALASLPRTVSMTHGTPLGTSFLEKLEGAVHTSDLVRDGAQMLQELRIFEWHLTKATSTHVYLLMAFIAQVALCYPTRHAINALSIVAMSNYVVTLLPHAFLEQLGIFRNSFHQPHGAVMFLTFNRDKTQRMLGSQIGSVDPIGTGVIRPPSFGVMFRHSAPGDLRPSPNILLCTDILFYNYNYIIF